MATILVVDDDADIRRYLSELLARAGQHQVVEACDGHDALRKATIHHPDLVISDLLMPKMDGFEFVRLLRSASTLEKTAVIFYSAVFVQQEAVELARACGAIFVLQKPCRSKVLVDTVNEALKARTPPSVESFNQAEFHSNHVTLLTNTLSQKITELEATNLQLAEAYDATLEGWVRALDLRDKETEGHSQRVTHVTVRLARVLGINETDVTHIGRGALLHDIGKLGVSDRILLKPGPLTAPERIDMERHPTLAYDMLRPISYLHPSLDIPYCHHEKWDGSGYPRGLRGEEIPLSARLFAVVDVWDALSSDRPYRSGWPSLDVNDYLWKHRGDHFDPRAVDVFMAHPEMAVCEPRQVATVRPPYQIALEAAVRDTPAQQDTGLENNVAH
jgi:cyclic di-GMP phosphodiesterase